MMFLGFSKEADAYPDLLHAYFGLSGLSLMRHDTELNDLNVAIGITKKVSVDVFVVEHSGYVLSLLC